MESTSRLGVLQLTIEKLKYLDLFKMRNAIRKNQTVFANTLKNASCLASNSF